MIKKMIPFMLMACVFAAINSCKHEIPVNPNDPGNGGGGGNGSTGVCFENDILPIFQSNCAKSGCHDAGSREDGYQLDNYANIVAKGVRAGNAADSKIYEVLIDNGNDRMPQAPNSPLTAAQITLIATWINEGARNTTNCASACDSSQFKYTANVKPILQTYCYGCHSGTAASGGGIPLDTYDGVKQQGLFGSLYVSINHTGTNPMPQNGARLSDCKIAVIRKWIEAGALNN
jgi:uncharacterized membrane protein